MSGEEDKKGKEHFREGKRHLEKGTQKVLEHGLEKGREHREKLQYYQSNRSKLIEDFSSRIGDSKEPAVSGLIVLLPIFATLLVVGWLFEKIAAIPGNQYFNISNYIEPLKSGSIAAYYLNQTLKLAILLVIGAALTTLVGRLVRTGRGFKLEKILDNAFNKIPFLGSIYNITKVTTETVFGGTDDLSRPVKVNHGDIRLTGFKTGNRSEDGREVIFLPTAPNITSGLVIELPDEKLEETEETAEQALTRILSAGFGQANNNGEKEED